ncbi:hypothetical protein [Sphingobacterium sp.]|uniref:hypothetical protein n=1 Tax=Sphingobacterium sp. TaxID=341027 RepID=UPI0031E274CE
MDTEYNLEYQKLRMITQSFYDSILFSIFNFSRGPENWKNNFFLRVSDEFIEGFESIEKMIQNGFRNQCRRELRFLIEVAIKAAFITQNTINEDFDKQLNTYRKLLKNPGINTINRINFPLFGKEDIKRNFLIEVKQMYGNLCNYVHLTPEQLTEKIKLSKDGKPFEKLTTEELKILNYEISLTFSYISVLLFNSMPQFVVGDFFQPGLPDYYYCKSKYIAEIDEKFDYKHERQANLEGIIKSRNEKIEF